MTRQKSDTSPHYGKDHSRDAARAALALADEGADLNKRINEIKHFISTAPEREKAKRNDNQTIPPPEPATRELYRHPVSALTTERPLIRRQAAAQLAARRKNMFVFIFSAVIFGIFACWVSQSL